LDVFRAEVVETTAKLDRLRERSVEIETEGKEAQDAISDCERTIQIQKNSTKAEVFQLKGLHRHLALYFIYLIGLQRNWMPFRIFIFGVQPRSIQI
jgi:hypothetical protein